MAHDLKAGGESPPYRHPGETVWVILKGVGRAWVEGEEIKVGPNTTVSIPAGASRQLFNQGPEELIMRTVRGTRPQQVGQAEKGLGL
jgi:mannose-6-phosphate isomerase-like protein (cupin superfamily)